MSFATHLLETLELHRSCNTASRLGEGRRWIRDLNGLCTYYTAPETNQSKPNISKMYNLFSTHKTGWHVDGTKSKEGKLNAHNQLTQSMIRLVWEWFVCHSGYSTFTFYVHQWITSTWQVALVISTYCISRALWNTWWFYKPQLHIRFHI